MATVGGSPKQGNTKPTSTVGSILSPKQGVFNNSPLLPGIPKYSGPDINYPLHVQPGPPVGSPPPAFHSGPSAGALNPIQGIQDGILSSLTGGKQNSYDQFSNDVNAQTQLLAKQHLANSAPVGSGTGSAYDAALASAMQGYNSGRNDLVNQGRLADSDLAQIFARTNQAQRQLQSNAIQGFHANNTRIGSTYDDLLSRIGSSYSAGGNSLANELKRLGIQEAGPGASQGLVRDSNFLTDMAGADRANALTNNNSASSLLANLMSSIRESTTASGASARAQNKIATQQGLAKLAQQLAAAKTNIAMGLSAKGKAVPETDAQKIAFAVDKAKALRDAGFGSQTGSPNGNNAALQYLLNYSNGNNAKATDLQGEYNFLQTLPGGLDAQLMHLYGMQPDPNNKGKTIPSTSGLGRWKKEGTYGQADADAVKQAMMILLGKA